MFRSSCDGRRERDRQGLRAGMGLMIIVGSRFDLRELGRG